jgi:hypothetical protein
MSTTEPPPAPPAATPAWMRVVFALAAVGMTVQWFNRLGQVRAGELSGGALAWNWIALAVLPLGAAYCAYRAAVATPRGAGPAAPPAPARGAGRGDS